MNTAALAARMRRLDQLALGVALEIQLERPIFSSGKSVLNTGAP
jgi:hypothetical protein